MRFNSRQILGVGSLVLFNVVLGTYKFVFVSKLMEKETIEQATQEMEIQRLKYKRAKKRDVEVRKKINQLENQWEGIVTLYTPSKDPHKGGIDLSNNRWQITADVQNYAHYLQRTLNSFMIQGGVSLVKAPLVPQPPVSAIDVVEQYFNYPSISFPVAVLEMGEVCIKGTYVQIMEHLKGWKKFKEAIPIIHQIKIAGTTPDLYAFYQLALVIYVKADKISPKVPEDVELGKPSQLQGVKK